MDHKYIEAELEYIIIPNIRPHFLIIEYKKDFFDIKICHPKYKGVEIGTRIREIFSLINYYKPDIIKENLLIIQCFDSSEMNDLLEFII